MKPMNGKEIVRAMMLMGWKRLHKKGIHITIQGPAGEKVTAPDLGAAPLCHELAQRILAFANLQP